MAKTLFTAAIFSLYLSSSIDVSNLSTEDYNSITERQTQSRKHNIISPLERGCSKGFFRLDSVRVNWNTRNNIHPCTRDTNLTIRISNNQNFEFEAQALCRDEGEIVLNGLIPGMYEISIKAIRDGRNIEMFEQSERNVCIKTMQPNLVFFVPSNSQTTS